MLHNPYPIQVDKTTIASTRFQTYLSGEDKALLAVVRPIKGTPQVVINNLIKNLCNELRELGITGYHPDADDIFAILVEPRELTNDQLLRLRCTTAGTNKQVSTRLQQHRGGSEVREGTSNAPAGANHIEKSVTKRKRSVGRKTSKAATKGRPTNR